MFFELKSDSDSIIIQGNGSLVYPNGELPVVFVSETGHLIGSFRCVKCRKWGCLEGSFECVICKSEQTVELLQETLDDMPSNMKRIIAGRTMIKFHGVWIPVKAH